MIHCQHRHPLGESYCVECNTDKVKADERQRVLDLINHRLTESASRDVRMALLRLKGDLLTSATPIAGSLRGQPTRQLLG